MSILKLAYRKKDNADDGDDARQTAEAGDGDAPVATRKWHTEGFKWHTEGFKRGVAYEGFKNKELETRLWPHSSRLRPFSCAAATPSRRHTHTFTHTVSGRPDSNTRGTLCLQAGCCLLARPALKTLLQLNSL